MRVKSPAEVNTAQRQAQRSLSYLKLRQVNLAKRISLGLKTNTVARKLLADKLAVGARTANPCAVGALHSICSAHNLLTTARPWRKHTVRRK